MGKLPFEKVRRVVLTKREGETSDKHGLYPNKLPMDVLIKTGMVVIDKPKGPTSHQVADYVKKILKLNKAGHSGTLDPGVSGVLPIALQDSTKIVQVLLPAGKEYVAVAHFHKDVSEEEIRAAFDNFIGKIIQLPPVKSAVKREERERSIYYIDILEIEGKEVLFKVGCQGGTYIRKLIHDIGRNLGGAHMAELRRTKAGPFNEDQLISLHELSDALYFYKKEGNEDKIRKCILPLETALGHLPKFYVTDNSVDNLCRGSNLNVPGVVKFDSKIKKKDLVAVLSLKGELIALGYATMQSKVILKSSKGRVVRTFRVFMQPGTYPRLNPKK